MVFKEEDFINNLDVGDVVQHWCSGELILLRKDLIRHHYCPSWVAVNSMGNIITVHENRCLKIARVYVGFCDGI